MLKEFLQQTSSTNGQARAYAIKHTVELANLIPPTVTYESRGHTLIIGSTVDILHVAKSLSSMTSLTLLSRDKTSLTNSLFDHKKQENHLYYADEISVTGFLGAFDVVITHNGAQHQLSQVALSQPHFDIVLDLSKNSVMTEEVAVPGYYPVGRGYPILDNALTEIQTLIGTFDKPKYFRLNSEHCAHSSRGIKGCERCVKSCPAGALTSKGDEKTGYYIDINPYLCQGVGTCATACPTEAIHYALPNPTDTQKFIERVLANYKQAGGMDPVVMICSARHEQYNVMALRMLPDNVIPISVEEIPSVGIDTWFAALVNGANQVLFAASRHMPQIIIDVLSQEIQIAQTLLHDLTMDKACIDMFYLESLREKLPTLLTQSAGLTLGELNGNKRQRLFTALDALAESQHLSAKITPLPNEAAYGTITCQSNNCTLCMSCVAVCPTRALHHSGDIPAIMFIEQDCVQCGMCEKACPEKALTRTTRMNWDKASRQAVITLHQEKPAECLRCHKPFAPQSMITKLQHQLRGHSQFSTNDALDRIAMCEDCRVIDMFESIADDPSKQLDY